MPHARQPDAATRALTPVLSLGLMALLCCGESNVVKPTVAPDSGRLRNRMRPPETSPPVTELSVEPESGPPSEPPPSAPIEVGPPAIRVRLDRLRGTRIDFGVNGNYRIYTGALDDPEPPAGRASIANGSNLAQGLADARQGSVRINGYDLGQSEVTILADRADAVRVGKRRYTGALILRASGNELTVINLVDLEDYVLGVLYAEMPERFANESLRAQAVISRTFALFHAEQGHELRDDQGSQMYVGLEQADASARRIVDSTFGEVLTFNGIPIETYFHSTCGGRTSSARDVFGIQAPPPLCKSVICPTCRNAPYYSWTRTVNRADIDRVFRNALGTNLRFDVSERDAAGRAVRVDLISSDGKIVDRPIGDRFRNDFNVGRPLARQLLSTCWTTITSDKKTVTIAGKGFGHGVGLCQYGAGGMASRGSDYRAILTHYFPGAELIRLYD